MKKLLILMLVFGLASVASAAYSLQVSYSGNTGTFFDPTNSELTIFPSDKIWIGAHYDGQGGGTGQGTVIVYFESAMPGEWTGNYQYYSDVIPDQSPSNPYLGNVFYGDTQVGALGLIDPVAYNMTYQNPSTQALSVGVADAKEFHCTDQGDVQIVMTTENFSPLDQLIIHQVPEPMTIALLGLGGLFLRRRK